MEPVESDDFGLVLARQELLEGGRGLRQLPLEGFGIRDRAELELHDWQRLIVPHVLLEKEGHDRLAVEQHGFEALQGESKRRPKTQDVECQAKERSDSKGCDIEDKGGPG